MLATALLLAFAPGPLTARDLAPFSALDTAVRRLPLPSTRTVAAVAKGLAPQARTPVERARAAYVWTVAHLADAPEPQTNAASALAALRGDDDAHAAVYAALCQALGVECVTVAGSLRLPPSRSAPRPFGARSLGHGQWLVPHVWNAVRIEGRWGLVDTAVAVRPADKGAAEPDDYFLADPAILATDHFPDDPKMRLADGPKDPVHAPWLRPFAWRKGMAASDLDARAQTESGQAVVRLRLAWRRGLRAVAETPSDRTLVQPRASGTEVRAAPSGDAVVWLGIFSSEGWRPLVGYPTTGSGRRPLPQVADRFYDTGASLEGPFEGELAAGKETEFRLRAPGASKVVAFQGDTPPVDFVRDGEAWTLRTRPLPGIVLDVMASYDDPEAFESLVAYDVR